MQSLDDDFYVRGAIGRRWYRSIPTRLEQFEVGREVHAVPVGPLPAWVAKSALSLSGAAS